MKSTPGSNDCAQFRYTLVDQLFSRQNASSAITRLGTRDTESSTILDLQRTLQESLDTREEQLSVLNSLMVKMMTYQELDPLLQHIAEIMIHSTIATNALILLVDETREYIQVVASAGSHSRRNIGERRHRGVGFAGLAWQSARTQYISNSDDNDMTRGFWPRGSQLLAEPLLADGDVIGVVVLGTPSLPVDFSTSRGLVNNLAGLAGIAIANAQSFEQSRTQILRMRALSDISKKLMSFKTIEELLSDITRILVSAMDINHSSGYRVTDDERLVADACWFKNENAVVPSEALPDSLIEESICGWCFRTREFASVKRNDKDSRISQRIHDLRKELHMGATLCMPITSDDRVVGVLNVSRNCSRRNFDEIEINLFRSVVNQVSNAFVTREMSIALQHQVNHDSLTHLPNRRCFEHELEEGLHTDNNTVVPFAVLFLDLDGFKAVNDTMGHARGDQLLQLVASRLSLSLEEHHLLARIGGDEFAVIARKLVDRQQAISMAFSLNKCLQEPFVINGSNVHIGASTGISFYPSDSTCADELLRYADEAMYQAKTRGEPRIVCFHRSMADATQQRRELEYELREAILKQQFVLHYQPQVNVQRGGVESVEALIRWEHPTQGLVSPGVFIPLAEETGLINVIGSWVLSEAINQLATWEQTPLGHLRIGVNIAAPQFLEEDFSDNLLRALSQASVCASRLEIEVTESIIMKDVGAVIKRLNCLRAAGIKVAIDDFGTGYSSLSYLRKLPLDTLKIDRAFINFNDAEQIDYSLVNTIVLMAQGLGLNTIAEGVESEAQLSQLMDLGCTLIQGFLFARPVSAAKLPETVGSIDAQLRSMQCLDYSRLKVANG